MIDMSPITMDCQKLDGLATFIANNAKAMKVALANGDSKTVSDALTGIERAIAFARSLNFEGA